MVAKKTIKKGFRTSIGWNLGKKNRSIHLLEPLTSIPIIGTKTKESKEIKKSIIENETITETFELNHQEKIEEIARMISDDNISDEARNAALKLLT